MTTADAVAFLLEGYGDDCPEGGDRYDEALLALSQAGLYDLHEGELSASWPRPKPNPMFALITEMYRPSVVDALNRDLMLGHLP